MSAIVNNLKLIIGPGRYIRQSMHNLLIETALQGPVRLLIGGNCFPVYTIAYDLAAQGGDYLTILAEQIHLSRAETAYQMTELLRQTEADQMATLVTEMLNPFMDDGLNEKEASQLLFESIIELRRLGKGNPVYVSSHEAPARPHLLMALANAVGTVQRPPGCRPEPKIQKGLV